MKYLIKTKYISLLLIFILAIGGCAGNPESSVSNSKVTTHFAIVLVNGVKTSDAIKSNIEDLPLEAQPILTDKDLISYKWKEHELELRQDFVFKDSLDNVPLDGLPFVVIANDKRVYLGAFWTPISSLAANIPAITIWPSNIQKNVIKIDAGYPSGLADNKSDPRSNQLIYNALKSVGKIKE